MLHAQREVVSRAIGEHVHRDDAAHRASEVTSTGESVAEHEIEPAIALAVRRAEERIVVLLRLRADLEVIYFENGTTSRVAPRELREEAAPRQR